MWHLSVHVRPAFHATKRRGALIRCPSFLQDGSPLHVPGNCLPTVPSPYATQKMGFLATPEEEHGVVLLLGFSLPRLVEDQEWMLLRPSPVRARRRRARLPR